MKIILKNSGGFLRDGQTEAEYPLPIKLPTRAMWGGR